MGGDVLNVGELWTDMWVNGAGGGTGGDGDPA